MPNYIRSLDELLDSERYGTFHDAVLLSTHVDYIAHVLVAEFNICVGDPAAQNEAARERRRRGRLKVDGLVLWSIEAVPLTDRGSQGL